MSMKHKGYGEQTVEVGDEVIAKRSRYRSDYGTLLKIEKGKSYIVAEVTHTDYKGSQRIRVTEKGGSKLSDHWHMDQTFDKASTLRFKVGDKVRSIADLDSPTTCPHTGAINTFVGAMVALSVNTLTIKGLCDDRGYEMEEGEGYNICLLDITNDFST